MKIIKTDGNNKDFYGLCVKLNDYFGTNVPGWKEAGMSSLFGMENFKDVFILFDGDRPIGSAGIWYHDEERVEVVRVFVDDDYRGQGLVKLLFDTVESFVVKKGYESLYLRTLRITPSAVRAYEKLGFDEVTAKEYKYTDKFTKALQFAESRVYMKKKLNK
ncbi:MAG: GNAT family N-acetyltransferase [Firmicutes bacterium]|nr:GNAT family N-acetyltransferase [Bacillota bacterium]